MLQLEISYNIYTRGVFRGGSWGSGNLDKSRNNRQGDCAIGGLHSLLKSVLNRDTLINQSAVA